MARADGGADPAAPYSRMPGGGISRRPLHFIILADCSASMRGEKIHALNNAIADMMAHLAAWERDQEQVQVFIRTIAFATEPRWHIPDPVPVTKVRWKPLQPVPKGLTNMGPAFALAAEALAPGRIERRALRPALLLITDGLATDPPGGFEAGLAKLMAQPTGEAALRLAVAIGRDARSEALDRFIGDSSVPVLVAGSTEDVADRLVAASLVVSGMSEVGADRGTLARSLFDTTTGVSSSGLPLAVPPVAARMERGGAVVEVFPGARPGGDSGPDPAGRTVLAPQRRYLRGQCPDGVPVGKPFSLLVSIVLTVGAGHAELEPFDVPPEGRDVLLVVHAPGLQLLSDQRQTVHVPSKENSRPVMFELRAETPGPRPVSVTAWLGGSYLGELLVEITAERDRPPGPDRDVLAAMATEATAGAVSLVVRYDPVQRAYRFEFRDEDNPGEVTSNLAYDPGPLVEQLVADLDELARGRSGYSAAQTRDYLVNAGARLWSQLVPGQLREQFWDRQHRIRQLTILADKDTVPWELLYPMDPGRDAGFLVEQFPVTRAIFRWLPSRTLNLRPTRFVLPGGSLPEARAEIEAMRRLLDPGQPPDEVISSLTPLQDLIAAGDFGLLHFACHNTYNSADGSSITLDNVRFTPTLMTTAAINKVLARSAPTIFINACRSAGLAATYNQLDGWASKFLEAGAAAFIGSLWAVSDGTAREFAQELYGQLQAGCPLGTAAMRARHAAATQPDDPTWLAYTVYGNPRATITGGAP